MSTEDARVVRAVVVGGAVGMTFWVLLYNGIRAVVDRFHQ